MRNIGQYNDIFAGRLERYSLRQVSSCLGWAAGSFNPNRSWPRLGVRDGL